MRQFCHELTDSKRRDVWGSWGSLQPYFKDAHGRDHLFNDLFSTYSWTWTSAANMVEAKDLLPTIPLPQTPLPPPTPAPFTRRKWWLPHRIPNHYHRSTSLTPPIPTEPRCTSVTPLTPLSRQRRSRSVAAVSFSSSRCSP